MDIALIDDASRTFHLIGLALGLGAAIMADMMALRFLKRPLEHTEIQTLERYHHTVAAGLFVFWVSGLAIMWIKTGFVLENFSPKLAMKICVVSILTFNAMLIGRIALPILKKREGESFCQLGTHERLRLAILAALSSASWISALSLGMFKDLAKMEWVMLSDIFVAVYAVTMTGAVVMALAAPLMHGISRDRKDPRLEPLRPISGLQIPSRAL